jgi:alpha-terpineol hydroxylase
VPYEIANGYYVALAAAGHDTTSSTTAGGLYGLLRFPGEFEKFKANPAGLAANFVEESIRWACPVKHFLRSTSEDVEIRGVRIPAQSRLFLSYPSGCRVEDEFERPDDFIIDRRPNNHVGFGFGPHVCLGLGLARLELRILFEELMPRLRSIELAGEPKRMEANFLSGIKSMPVRFTKN